MIVDCDSIHLMNQIIANVAGSIIFSLFWVLAIMIECWIIGLFYVLIHTSLKGLFNELNK